MRTRQVAEFGIIFLIGIAAPIGAQTMLSLPRFDSLELLGGGNVVVRHGPEQRVTIVEGSPQISDISVDRQGRNRGRLLIKACRERCPDGYKLRVAIQTPDVKPMAVKGGGTIVIREGFGRASELTVAVSGGGQIDARALAASSAAASVHGGGSLLVGPSNSLAASVTGGGLVRYLGNPQVSSSIMGGGRVVRANGR